MSAAATPGLVLSAEPHAQLLPPSVKQREKSRASRRLMAMLVVVSVVVAAAGVTWGYVRQVQAQLELEASQQRTAEILALQGQFADAARLADLVDKSEKAEEIVTATEIQWAPLFIAVAAYVPADVRFAGVAFQAPAPWETPFGPEGPLREPRVAVMTIELAGSSFEPASRFVAAIPSIYGFSDVKIDKTEFKDGEYLTTVKLTLNADAVSGRFLAEDETDETTEGSDEE